MIKSNNGAKDKTIEVDFIQPRTFGKTSANTKITAVITNVDNIIAIFSSFVNNSWNIIAEIDDEDILHILPHNKAALINLSLLSINLIASFAEERPSLAKTNKRSFEADIKAASDIEKKPDKTNKQTRRRTSV